MAEKNNSRFEFFVRILYAIAALLALLAVLSQAGIITGSETTYAITLLAVAIWLLCIGGNRLVHAIVA
jgi:hypothetical protein